jgi:hypothetical protein
MRIADLKSIVARQKAPQMAKSVTQSWQIFFRKLRQPIETMYSSSIVGFHAELSRFFHREVSHL